MSIKNSLKVFDIVFKDRLRHRLGNLVLQTFLFTLFHNINDYLKKTSSSVVFYAFLKMPASQEKISSIKKSISNWPEVANVKIISQDEGLNLLKRSLGKESAILNTLGTNPLPYTLEINIKPEYTEKSLLTQTGEKLKRNDAIDWTDSTEKFISPFLQIKKYSTFIFGAGLLTVVFLILLTLRATNRIFFFKYKDSFYTLKLLGANNLFIMLPFVLEGFLEVLFSSSLSSAISYYLTKLLSEELLLINIQVKLLPPAFYAAIITLFSLVGAIGGFSLKNKEL